MLGRMRASLRQNLASSLEIFQRRKKIEAEKARQTELAKLTVKENFRSYND